MNSLLRFGTTTVKANFFAVFTLAFLSDSSTSYRPGFVGRPEIVRVFALNLRPVGSPFAETVGMECELTLTCFVQSPSTVNTSPAEMFATERLASSSSFVMNLATISTFRAGAT